MGTRHVNYEFMNEDNLLGRVQHRNLVKLLGYSVKGSFTECIFHYGLWMSKGSLLQLISERSFLHPPAYPKITRD